MTGPVERLVDAAGLRELVHQHALTEEAREKRRRDIEASLTPADLAAEQHDVAFLLGELRRRGELHAIVRAAEDDVAAAVLADLGTYAELAEAIEHAAVLLAFRGYYDPAERLLRLWEAHASTSHDAAAPPGEVAPAARPTGRIEVHTQPVGDAGFAAGLQIGYAEGRGARRG